MCTTARRLRRCTHVGMARKFAKRRITSQIKSLQQTMFRMKPWSNVGPIIERLSSLIRLRKAIKV